MPVYESSAYGEHPKGLHWSPGKRRSVELGDDLPPWLKVAKPAPKPKAKSKTKPDPK